MSLAQYLLWGYLALFAVVAFFVYAACVAAGRADNAEEARQMKRSMQQGAPPQPSATKPLPAQPEHPASPVVTLDREQITG